MVTAISAGIYAGLGVAAAAGLAAGGYAYASLWPGSRIFGEALIAPRRPGELALTFDDGPNATWTPRLLDVLAKHNVRATFFMLGSRAAEQPELVRRVVAAGHRIGEHTWSHPRLSMIASDRIREELLRAKETLQQITGKPIRLIRPPFGARRPALFRIARELDLQPVLWNAMTSDWSDPSAERITAKLARRITSLELDGLAANIVLHDGGHLDPAAHRAPSVAAADRLITLYKGNHRFVTLDAWAAGAAPNHPAQPNS
jgi:peptidoglycan-N-acetylglucosamine deacetylase